LGELFYFFLEVVMGGKNYIPSRDADFDSWLKNLINYVMSKTGSSSSDWDHIPQSHLEALNVALVDWDVHYRPTLEPHTPAITVGKNNARKRAEHVVREFVQRFLYWDPVTDEDRVNMGLLLRSGMRSPIATPTGQAHADITYPGPHLLALFPKLLEGTLADARADHGFRIYFGVLPVGGASLEEAAGPERYLRSSPVSGEDLPHSKFSRKHKVLFEFPSEDSGRSVFFSIRLENAKGDMGPWGPVFSAVIP
jgi:hypothetical protein